MKYVKDIQAKLKGLQKQLPVIAREVVNTRRNDIITYYQENQIGQGLKKGIRKDAVVIGWYAKVTEEEWIAWWGGHPPYHKYFRDAYNMEWTGDFFRGMFIFFPDKFSFEISSRDKKTPKLLKSYGDLFTLTYEVKTSIETLFIEPDFTEKFNKRFSSII